MNKSVLIAVPIIAIIVGTMAISSAHASIIGDFGIGYQNGKNETYNGYAEADCSQYSNSYCLGYTAGYNVELFAIQQAQP